MLEHDGVVAGHKITALIEYFVLWQMLFAVGADTLTPQQHGGGIVMMTVFKDRQANNDGQIERPGRFGQLHQSRIRLAIEIRAQQQVFRRITAQAQLRCQQQIGAISDGLARNIDDPPGIAREVTEHHVHLSDCDPH